MNQSLFKLPVFLGFVFLLTLNGCISLSEKDLVNAEFGRIPHDYQEQIKLRMEQSLFDPYSAHYEIGQPYRAGEKIGLIHGGGWKFGYAVDALVNAKNRYGAYVGNKSYTFIFYQGTPHQIRNFHGFRRVPKEM